MKNKQNKPKIGGRRQKMRGFRCSDAVWRMVEESAAMLEISANQWLLWAVNRQLADPVYEETAEITRDVAHLEIADAVKDMKRVMSDSTRRIDELKAWLEKERADIDASKREGGF